VSEVSVRPLVVLVPDAMAWVLGSWAREIALHNADAFDFAIFPLAQTREDPDGFAAVLAEASVVHCLSQFAYAEVEERVRALGGRRVRLISSIHHIVDPEDIEPCLRGDRIAVMCGSVADQLVGLGVSRERLYLLRKGVDTQRLQARSRSGARKRLGIPGDAFAVGVSAKASSDDRGRKGIDVLFAALERLPASEERPLRLVVTGPGWAEVLARHAPEGLAVARFDYLPEDAMPDFYSAVDVYLNTSRIEGGPMPPLEAMSCETPVVSTPVGTVRDLVSDGSEGLIVPVGDAVRTAEALATLRDDPDVCAGLGRAGRRRIETSLDVRDVTRNAAALYASLASEGRARSLDRETLARDDAARIERDLARWRRELPGGEPDVGRSSALATWIALGLRRVRRVLEAAVAPLPELLHIDLGALGVTASSRVLDLGCGAGQLSLPLSERCALALSIDLDMPRLRELRDSGTEQHLPVRPVCGDAARLPLADVSLDAVVCREVLEHIDEPGEVLDEIRRVLSPEGKLCVTVPSAHTERWFQWVDSRWLDMAGHVHVFRRSEMCALLERHGFRIRSVRGRNCFYSFFWFIHTLVGTRHDGTGRIQDHHVLAARIFRVWSWLGEGRARRIVERLCNAIVPKSYVYYCEPRESATRRA
jgi:glycosyltransferase involved in cell wall biosynthesis/SAM-dependent methyltransferase